MPSAYQRLITRADTLLNKLTDAKIELASLKLIRREVSKSQYQRRTKALKAKIAKLDDEYYYANKDAKDLKKQKTDAFITELRKKFRGNRAFTIKFGNEFISDADVLKFVAQQQGRWTLNVDNRYYVLNDATRQRLGRLVESDMIVDEESTESEQQIAQTVNESHQFRVEPVVRPVNAYAFQEGAFFKWFHTTQFDLSRYGIFRNKDEATYEDNCFIVALRTAGVSEEKIIIAKQAVQNRHVPVSAFHELCKKLEITIKLKTHDIKHNHRHVYGTSSETYMIGLLENHYFAIEPTQITSYCLNHYNEVKNEKECHRIHRLNGKYYERDDKHYIDSYDVIKCLLANKDTLLTEITMEQMFIASTQFYDRVDTKITNLAYDISGCVHEIKIPTETSIKYKNVFFDFETYVRNGVHVPYLCRTWDGKTSRAFYGEECGRKMLFSLTSNTRLIAHNATYDLRFIIEYLSQITELSRGTRLISLQAKFRDYFIQVKDSYHLITMPLSKFPKVFGIEGIMKEVMPYDLYNQETVAQRFVPIEYALRYVAESDKDQFLANIKQWNLQKEDTYDIIEYSSRYCEIDCKLLQQGYDIFNGWIKSQLNLDTNQILTSASLADRYFIAQGCYDDVLELGGVPQMFIQGCVVGGRTMCAENTKRMVNGRINDFDAVSLYPSAMKRMDGFLKGTPKVIENLNYDWLKEQDGYFVDIRITGVGVHRKFPLMSYKNNEGVRIFTNDMIGKEVRVDKTTLEDLIQYQGITFDVLRGYYFNEGVNNTINTVIQYLFEERKKMKAQKNPAEMVYKLIMNSGYGKSIMKPVLTESRFFDDDETFKRFLDRHYNWVTQYVRFGTKLKVTLVKSVIDHYNRCHVGSMILSMSKRIMNEVMCLAEDNGLEMFYQDTDSIHIRDADIKTLADAFRVKYGRVLIGNELGQFHSDFDIAGAENVYATRSIFLTKKMYCDELIGEKDGKQIVDYHIRMKGIPNKVILYHVQKYGYKNVMDMYEDLYNGATIAFDLTNDGTKANFKFNKDYSINTLSIFTRNIRVQ